MKLLNFRFPVVEFCVLLSSVLWASRVGAQGATAPVIQICEGGQTVCIQDNVVDLCVKVTVEADYSETIDSFQINWDDGAEPVSLPGSNASFDLSHRYDFGAFLESCSYQSQRLISLYTYINGEERPIISSFPLTALNPP